jgi:hypothetical protein
MAGTVLRKDYSLSVYGCAKRRKVSCYYTGNIGHPPKPGRSQKWSNDIVSICLNLRKQCDIVVKQAKMLRKAIASTTPVKRKAVKANPKLKSLGKTLCRKQTSLGKILCRKQRVCERSFYETKAIATHCIVAAIHSPIESVVPPSAIATHCSVAAIHSPIESVVPPSPFTKSQLVRKPRLSGPVLSARSFPQEWNTKQEKQLLIREAGKFVEPLQTLKIP